MIGSFWNLCRACPSMPVDKLHSEYRSTYRWHEYTGPRQEVVRRPPQTNVTEKSNDISAVRNNEEDSYSTEAGHKPEPAMPRRKKYPDLAYRHHEFIVSDGTNDFDSADRARSEERNGLEWKSSRRSKSEGPARNAVHVDGSAERERERRRESDPDMENMNTGHTSRREAAGFTPRKSHSMGALKARAQANAMVHKNRIHLENKDASELEPLVDEGNNRDKCRESFHSEYKKNYRPFSQYEYTERGFSSKRVDPIEEVQKHLESDKNSSWYREVVELRKKAGEYKHREWGSDLAPERLTDIYNKQIELWDQVSRRSSLSALSLASMTHKNYTKEEKDDDNNRKSSPTKAYRNAENSVRMIRDIIRHHLERTTGGSEMDGLILSPTREKLEPTIPRKDDDSRGSQKNSPKKSSPMKSSSLKRTNQKAKQGGPKKLRSQSVGPTTESSVEKRSPKRQSRSTTAKEGRKSSSETPSNKRPRPSDETKTDAVENKDTSTNEEYDSLTYEPVIKSPPEPTRVKSPEQIIMRSPDPVNWTVPLDTGKTFTVTQNVREGDLGSRPHSEVKVWTPPDIPPPVAQSAPPTLIEQSKEPAGLS
ncbi:proteoglycan 4 isoform X11 [Diorhabda carinulata]|uniref:proteoglycan 4 isoform X11 n=1 Tax=Diorhabda carinulata TaxID=1163345 RepID=UPI0025A19F03|nr:proteoglycan 4 isoform X11 [Diorhabda carinulata]